MRPERGSYTPPIMARVPVPSNPLLADWTARAFDRERKLIRALVELGQIAGRDVAVVGAIPIWLLDELHGSGARVLGGSSGDPGTAGGADVVLGAWSSFREAHDIAIAASLELLRPGGRLLVVHDYGRDEIDRLMGDRPESTTWSRRGGPFTEAGFKIRVVHCWWTFDAMEDAARFLHDAFGDAGTEFAATLRRPRIAHNVAIYHRDATSA